MVMGDNPDHIMAGMGVRDTTEFAPEGTLTLDPSMLHMDAPIVLAEFSSPEDERPAQRRPGQRLNGNFFSNGHVSPSTFDNKQEIATGVMAKPSRSRVLPYSTSSTGLVYDVRMRFHVEVRPEQNQGVHPEDPRRIYAIYQELVDAGLVFVEDSDLTAEHVLGRIPTRNATKDEICAIHSEAHFEWVMGLKDWDNDLLHDAGEGLDSIYLSKNSPSCALLSAGGAIEACRAILDGQSKNAIAVIRPPGHHAEHDRPMGFCFFNNVPIAARACQKNYPDKCRKVLILDWDVHHGNGVQQAFYDDPNVLYISLHVHQGGSFYPAGDYGDHVHCGEGSGLGKNVNIPWKTAGMTDGDYIYAFQQVVMPIAQDFDPDLVIVSAGFDAAEGDMLGKCHVTPAGYAHMTHALMSLAGGKVAVCLEGGYNLRSIAVSALAVTRTLMGEPPDRLLQVEPTTSGVDTVQMVLRTQSKFWPCLYPKDPADRLRSSDACRMHDLVREWQSKVLFDNYGMSAMFIARSKISKSYENQVLGTHDYAEERPLLLIVHDPPELHGGSSDPRTQKVELHNSWLTDIVKSYVDWATKRGFSVIDVNIPKHYTGLEDDYETHAEDSQTEKSREAHELVTYVWQNYIEIHERPQIFIIGVGAAYSSIVRMLKENNTMREQIGEEGRIFSFISDSDPLHAYKSTTDDYLAERWYRQASSIFVAKDHYIWERSKHKAPSKRWGRLVQSPHNETQDMLMAHKDQVFEEMMELTEDWRSGRRSSISSMDELAIAQQPQSVATAGQTHATDGDVFGVLTHPMELDGPDFPSAGAASRRSPSKGLSPVKR